MARSLEPQRIGEHDWYYEYPTYMLIVHEAKEADGTLIRTDQIKIPWRRIKVSLERSYKQKRRP